MTCRYHYAGNGMSCQAPRPLCCHGNTMAATRPGLAASGILSFFSQAILAGPGGSIPLTPQRRILISLSRLRGLESRRLLLLPPGGWLPLPASHLLAGWERETSPGRKTIPFSQVSLSVSLSHVCMLRSGEVKKKMSIMHGHPQVDMHI